MQRSMTYTDSRGRKQRLTSEQANYLETAWSQGGFDRGWGGLSSTLTVRILRERGLITLDDRWHPKWRVTGTTPLGEQVLARWRELQQ